MENELLKGIGARIAARRKSLSLTQEQVADELDVSIQMISNLERGQKAVRLPNLIKLSRFLNISCDYILTGERSADDHKELFAKLQRLSPEDFSMIELLVDYCLKK